MMNNRNGRPLSRRRQIQFLVIVTLLCWATQTLMSQWGFGAEVYVSYADDSSAGAFVPVATSASAPIEFRSQAKVTGELITLRHVCRWSEADAATYEPVADLALAKIPDGRTFVSISVEQLRQTLRDAGVNMARVQLSGAMTCTITRTDAGALGQGEGLQQWIAAREQQIPSLDAPKQMSAAPLTSDEADLAADGEPAEVVEPVVYRTLKQILIDDLARTLNMDAANLLVEFKTNDDTVLRLTEPHFQFQFEPRRGRMLGQVGWEVYIINGGERRRASITATARAWQQQLVMVQPVSHRQVIREEDVVERRTLIDRLSDDVLLTRAQTVGNMAATELRAGMIVNARMVDAVPLARRGQLITITLRQGNIELKSVGRAMENGSYGQTIRVKNEVSGDVQQVVLTAPQAADLSPSADLAPSDPYAAASLLPN